MLKYKVRSNSLSKSHAVSRSLLGVLVDDLLALVDFINKLVVGDGGVDLGLDLFVGDVGGLLVEQRHQSVGDLLVLGCRIADLGHELRLVVFLYVVWQVVELVHSGLYI